MDDNNIKEILKERDRYTIILLFCGLVIGTIITVSLLILFYKILI